MARSRRWRPGDRLIELLMAEEGLFERLEDFHPPAARFRRVLLDEETAGALDLGDVAAMLDLPLGHLLALADGIEPAADDAPGEPPLCDDAERIGDGLPAAWRIDVRPLLDAGHEPLRHILALASQVGRGEAMLVESSFHPKPLRRLLRRRGFASCARQLAHDHWQVLFHREAGAGPA